MQDDDTFDPAATIAIVGMAGRFPKAPDIEAYWQNIRGGIECLTRFTAEELEAAGEDPHRIALPNYVPVGGPLEAMDEFDAGFFGFSPRDASILDPQHRHILECAWEALEHAAIDPARFGGSIGVFAGSGHNAYMPYNLLTNAQLVDSVGFFLLRHTGNDKDFLATRISYCLNLTGPSVNVQTACSTSLVAVHIAAQSLLNGECDLALAGGVTIEMPHRRGYLYEEGEIMSPDGHCRSFDAASKGTLFGSGAGVVALRRYEDAVEAGDVIHALVRGSAINNDGANKVGYLAPSVEGQASCIAEALALSGLDPRTVTYVECHGTGTPVGDPIEVAALTQAFREETQDTQFCGIGSVKSNIGHLDTAAGVASLIKTVQALKHRELPPSLHYRSPNPQIDFAASPFFVNATLQPWEVDGFPRRAAVNSLGVGGTNAFVLLEEAPEPELAEVRPSRPLQLIALSGRNAEVVTRASERLAGHLRAQPAIDLADVAFTLTTGRHAFKHRRVVVATDAADAAAALAANDPTRVFTQQAGDRRSVAFVFPGGGAQYPNMGRDLYEQEAVYRDEIDRGLAALAKHVEFDLKSLLFPAPGDEERAGEELQHGSRTLPALFITEYALAKLFMSWGVTPAALLGHSMGEYVAACLADVFSMEDGLRMVLKRGQLFEKLAPGAMLSVPLPASELAALIGDTLDVAVVNGPSASVASGPVEAIDALEQQLLAREVDVRRIKIHVAAHSRMLDPILAEFGALTKTIAMKAPQLPVLSNVSGTWMTAEQATDPDYWVRHLRGTVQFSKNLEALLEDEERVVLEVAPGRTLSSLAKAHPRAGLGRPVFNSLRHPKEEIRDTDYLLGVLGRLWLCGVDIDFGAYFAGETRQRLTLPTYPFEHKRYWIEPGKTQGAATTRSLRKKPDVGDWFYQPSWKRQLLPAVGKRADETAQATAGRVWLVFLDEVGFGAELVSALRAAGDTCVTVGVGAAFEKRGDHEFVLRPDAADDYDELWSTLEADARVPGRILHLWSLADGATPGGIDHCAAAQDRGFYSLLFLAQALGKAGAEQVAVAVISNRLQAVGAEPLVLPERATVLGPCKVMMQELAGVSARSIDIDLPPAGSWQRKLLIERIPHELDESTTDHVVAYRGHERYVQRFEPTRLLPPTPASTRLREGGVYLVTGGLGGLGLVVARHLREAWKARLVLVGRTALPPRDAWDAHVAAHGHDDRVSRRIAQVRELESHSPTGANEVMIATCDVTDAAALERVVAAARDRFGAVHGVFHTAGVLNDGIIQLKTREDAAAVLAPKVMGTLALDRALSGVALDFMVLFSSVSSLTGLTGQVDYAAANAFLDAFAHARTARDGVLTVAINWNAWQQVGMAAELARELGLGGSGAASRPAKHVLLDRCLQDGGDRRVFATTFRPETHWLLDEHRIKGGNALIPGTGYLELARAALAEGAPENVAGAARVVELSDLSFQAPFVVRDGEARELTINLQRAGDEGWDVSICGSGDRTHAVGQARWVADPSPPPLDLAAIAQRCQEREQRFDSAADAHLDFGPRWNNRQSVSFGRGEALVRLALPAAFADDAGAFALHPALMDFATAGAQALVPGFGADTHFFVPMSYGRVLALAPLPAQVVSHVRLKESSDALAVYDVTVADTSGRVLVEIAEFVMRRVEDRAVMSEIASAASGASVEARPDHEPTPERKASTANPILELGLAQGIAPAEGMAALERVLAAPLTAQVVVSSQDLEAIIESTRAPEPWEADAAPEEAAGTKVTRPNIATAFVAPESDLDKTIVAVWEELLGISGIGIHDDFFDLGGHSLLLTQLVSRVRKQIKAEVSLRSLFEKRTVAGIAEEVTKARDGGAKDPKLKRVARDAYRVKRNK